MCGFKALLQLLGFEYRINLYCARLCFVAAIEKHLLDPIQVRLVGLSMYIRHAQSSSS